MGTMYEDITDLCTFSKNNGDIVTNSNIIITYEDETIEIPIYSYPRNEFNSPYIMGDSILENCSNMFKDCTNLNQMIHIGNNVYNCNNLCRNCVMLNLPIYIGSNVRDCSYMFYNCQNFNTSIELPNNVETCSSMFGVCYNLNQPINIPYRVSNCYCMFTSCRNFNQLINIPDNALNCSSMFSSCTNLDQPINIPYGVSNCSTMFMMCRNFNQPINIISKKGSYLDCGTMFAWCNALNSPINIFASSFVRMTNMFQNCNNLNQVITIDAEYFNANYMFMECTNFQSDIYFSNRLLESNFSNIRNMLYNHGSKWVNIHCTNNKKGLFMGSGYNTVIGYSMTWTNNVDNYCSYNSGYRVRIYGDVPE